MSLTTEMDELFKKQKLLIYLDFLIIIGEHSLVTSEELNQLKNGLESVNESDRELTQELIKEIIKSNLKNNG
jgi:hypothetical protein